MSAYYLKYRPQSLAELIGQETVKKTLLSSFQNNRLSHAYLFVGPRGTGKTSTARILAKMVNCEVGGPCNKCATCISITDGSNLDLIEIDAASNRGIEDIRTLREKIKLAPTQSKKKVYIIDEVHMLTTEAFNALLKTLEEPPNHALFILATTESSKIPQTILSRVQRLDFKLASQKELSEALEKIIRVEKIDISEEALQILKDASQGSFRDAIKLLDQISGVDKKIDALEMAKTLHSTDIKQVFKLLEYLAAGDVKNSLLLINELAKFGVDFKILTVSIMEMMRELILIKNDLGLNLVQPQYGSDEYSNLVRLAEKFSIKDLSKDLDISQKGYERLKNASIASLPLELAVVEMTQSVILNEVSPKVDEESKDLLPTAPVISKRVEKEVTVSSSEVSSVSDSPDIQKLKEKWTYVCETIRSFNFSLEALLRSINIADCSETAVVMEVPYSFHQRILEAPKNRELLESILSEILGRQIKVMTILGARPVKREDVVNIEVAADDEIIRAAAEIFNSDSVN